MGFIADFALYVASFLLILSVIVFVHEWGHYIVARWNGVRVEVFSIGFGRELFGFTDRAGTRWKFSLIPLGGYVKFMGDADATSTTIDLSRAADDEAFTSKSVWRRMAIVAAGPFANFAFAIAVLAVLFVAIGRPFTPPVIGTVNEDSPAEAAGLVEGDRITAVDSRAIESFEQLQDRVRFAQEQELVFTITRDGETLQVPVVPEMTEITDRFGNTHRIALVGISTAGVEFRQSNPFMAPLEATGETVRLVGAVLHAVGQMIAGTRGTEELGGPLRIAQMSGEVARDGLVPLFWFAAILSINLGLINLFPIPMLDGGHLVLYTVEAARGKQSGRTQEIQRLIGRSLRAATWEMRWVYARPTAGHCMPRL
jgi:regulator of sigma E protease